MSKGVELITIPKHPGPSAHDIEHMTEIITGNYGDWFSAELLRLIRKADIDNRNRLRVMFPYHVKAYEDWYNGERT